jgi:hypothetical protein
MGSDHYSLAARDAPDSRPRPIRKPGGRWLLLPQQEPPQLCFLVGFVRVIVQARVEKVVEIGLEPTVHAGVGSTNHP